LGNALGSENWINVWEGRDRSGADLSGGQRAWEAATGVAKYALAVITVVGAKASLGRGGAAAKANPAAPRAGDPATVVAPKGTVHPSTPVGHRGKPLNVVPGTNSPTTIGGRKFTGHALDRMQEQGLTPSVIEDAISRGTRIPGRDGTTVFTTDQAQVIINSLGDVITVYPQ
jgi:hypothetical protein